MQNNNRSQTAKVFTITVDPLPATQCHYARTQLYFKLTSLGINGATIRVIREG